MMSSATAGTIPAALFTEPPSSLIQVQQHHAHMVKTGHMQSTFAASRLLYAAATAAGGDAGLRYCRSIFDKIPEPNSFTWNALIQAYAGCSSSDRRLALVLFVDMLSCGSRVLPDRFTFPRILNVCATLGAVEMARQVHGRVVKTGFRSDMFVMNTLLHAYAVAGREVEAVALFGGMPDKDVVSWSSLISYYTTRGETGKARALFDEMPAGVRNTETWNFMLSGYVNAGMVSQARVLFDEMRDKDVVSWNAMIAAYAHVARSDEALVLFGEMLRRADVKPNARTLVSVLSACARLGAVGQGQWVHAYMERNGIQGEDGFLCAALVDMYSKCGSIDKAVSVFEGSRGRRPKDMRVWNSMIGGLGSHGRGQEAVELFEEMTWRGIERDEVSFLNALSACRQGGLVEEGKRIFNELLSASSSGQGTKPNVMHYGCMVDMLARAGDLEAAVRIITSSSSVLDVEGEGGEQSSASVLWGTLLNCCRIHGDVELAKLVAPELEALAGTASSYPLVKLSNVYASAIEVDGTIHEFFSRDGRHR